MAAGVGSGGLGLAQPDEGVEVGRLAGLAELYGQGGDLTAAMAGVNGQGAPGAGQRLIEAVGVQCTPAALAQPGGVALGAQAGPAAVRQLADDAGFSRFRQVTQTPVNVVLELRP